MKRIKLQNRRLPEYSLAEELVNAISHGLGAILGIVVLLLCTRKVGADPFALVGCVIYGVCMTMLYSISALYHSLRPGMTKKVFQILDHCTIYILIAGTYTPILLTAFVRQVPWLGWGLLAVQWGVSALAITLTAIDLHRFRFFSYASYIILGWVIIFFLPATIRLIGMQGLLWLLAGGISYTVGAVLYAIGAKRPWFHSAFHVFVIAGSFLQFIAIYLHIL